MFTKAVEKLKRPFLFLSLTLAGLIIPKIASAEGIAEQMGNWIIGGFIRWVVIRPALFGARIVGRLVSWTISPDGFIQHSYTNPAGNPIIRAGLNVTQGLVNMILVLILIFIALATILRIKEYQAQKLILPFIIIALLVNFTPVICGLIVDASNILMNFFVERIGDESFTSAIETKIRADALTGGDKLGETLIEYMFLIPFIFLLNIILLLFALIFTLRHFAIWILVILSPIAFLSYILPVTRRWWSSWWNQFIKWSLIGITCTFFLYLALLFTSQAAGISSPETTDVAPTITSLLKWLTGIVFLWIGLITGYKTSAMGAGAIVNLAKSRGKSLVKGVARRTTKAGKWVGGRVKERVARPLTEKARFKEAAGRIVKEAEKHRITRWALPESFRKYGQMRPAVEKAEARAKDYSSPTLAHRVKTGADTQVDATGDILEMINRGDSQDLFNEFRTRKDMTDEDILKSKEFRKKVIRPLQIAKESGKLSPLIRKDPRLAALVAGKEWGGAYRDMSSAQAIQHASSEARRSHVNNWEKEVVEDRNVMNSLLGRGREIYEAIDSQVKEGQPTAQNTIDRLFSRYVDRFGESLGVDISKPLGPEEEELLWEEYHEYYKKRHRGQDGFFQALESERFKDRGWRRGQYIPPSKRQAKPTRGTLSTPASSLGMIPGGPGYGAPPKGYDKGYKLPPKPKIQQKDVPRTGKAGKKQKDVPRTGKAGKKRKNISTAGGAAQVPFMITQKMKKDLKKLGYKDKDIKKMTPQQAWDVLNK